MFKPLGNRVLVKELAPAQVSAGGIFIPPTAKEKNAPVKATVISVGPGMIQNGTRQSIPLQEGDTVIVAAYQGLEVKLEGATFKVVDFDQVLAVVEED